MNDFRRFDFLNEFTGMGSSRDYGVSAPLLWRTGKGTIDGKDAFPKANEETEFSSFS
jgi:hypothetical protein